MNRMPFRTKMDMGGSNFSFITVALSGILTN